MRPPPVLEVMTCVVDEQMSFKSLSFPFWSAAFRADRYSGLSKCSSDGTGARFLQRSFGWLLTRSDGDVCPGMSMAAWSGGGEMPTVFEISLRQTAWLTLFKDG